MSCDSFVSMVGVNRYVERDTLLQACYDSFPFGNEHHAETNALFALVSGTITSFPFIRIVSFDFTNKVPGDQLFPST